MSESNEKILILGLGNILLQDEGIGIHVLRELEKTEWPDHIDLLDGGTGGFVLLSLFQDYNNLLIIDATLSEEPEGTVKVIKPRFATDFPKSLSTHELGLKDMIESAILLGKVPDITLITISIKPEQEMSIELSPKLQTCIPDVVKVINDILNTRYL